LIVKSSRSYAPAALHYQRYMRCLLDSLESDEERFEFFVTISAHFQMMLDKRHGLLDIFSFEQVVHEFVQLGVAFLAADLIIAGFRDLADQFFKFFEV